MDHRSSSSTPVDRCLPARSAYPSQGSRLVEIQTSHPIARCCNRAHRAGSLALLLSSGLLSHCDGGFPKGDAPASSATTLESVPIAPAAASLALNAPPLGILEVTLKVPDFQAPRSEALDASMMEFLRRYRSVNATGWGDKPNRRRGWAYGIYIDAELGDYEGVWYLLADIDKDAPSAPSADGAWRLGRYPAYSALLKGDYWSVRAAIGTIASEPLPTRRAMMAEVVVKILGAKMTRWYLRDIIHDPITRREIENALAGLDAGEWMPPALDVPLVSAVQHDSYTFRVPDLTGDVQAGAHVAVLELIATHRALRADLAARLGSGKTSDVGKTYLIYMLGQMAAIEATEPLLDAIDFKAPFTDVKGSAQRWDSRPALAALRWLGLSSVRAIMKRLPTETVELRRQLMCEAVHGLLGREVTRAMIDDALLNEPDKRRQEGWREAIRTQEQTP